MKRVALLAVLAGSAGCSNAPVAGFLDNCFPSKARTDTAAPGPGPSVEPGGPTVPAPRPKSDAPIPPPDLGTGAP